MLLSEFSRAEKIPCPGTIFCNNCEQQNMLGDILNAGDNVDYQEDYGFRESFLKISLTVIDNYTRKKLLNTQLENLIPKRNIQNNDKYPDEINQINMIDEKESDERYQIGENKENKLSTFIEVLKLRKLSSQKKIDYIEK